MLNEVNLRSDLKGIPQNLAVICLSPMLNPLVFYLEGCSTQKWVTTSGNRGFQGYVKVIRLVIEIYSYIETTYRNTGLFLSPVLADTGLYWLKSCLAYSPSSLLPER